MTRWGKRCGVAGVVATLLALTPLACLGDDRSGPDIMAEAFRRQQQAPFVYEELTMVLMDFLGQRDVRKLRRYSRVDGDGTVRFLAIFDSPPEAYGVALLYQRDADGLAESSVYFPALDDKMRPSRGGGRGAHFLGSDFAMADFTPEQSARFRYRRAGDRRIDKVDHYVVEAIPVEGEKDLGPRRHIVRQDNFFIVQTDFLDDQGRLVKRRSSHDLRLIQGTLWRAGNLLMDSPAERHKTLVRVDRRVFSPDYVPLEMFSPEWIVAGNHMRAFGLPAVSDAEGKRP